MESRTEHLGHRISRNILSRIERDDYRTLSPDQVRVICRALNMSADWWFMGDEQPADVIGRQAAQLCERDREVVLALIDTLQRMAE